MIVTGIGFLKMLKNTLEIIVRGLVDSADNLEVEEGGFGDFKSYMVKVPQEEIGKVLGKRGRTIGAIRHIMHAIASKESLRVSVEVQESNVTTNGSQV